MNWGSWDAFFAMGGYGLYVWGSYIVTGVAIAAEVLLALRRRTSALEGIARCADNESRWKNV